MNFFFRVSCCGYFEVNMVNGYRTNSIRLLLCVCWLILLFIILFGLHDFKHSFFSVFFSPCAQHRIGVMRGYHWPFSTHNFAASAKSRLRWNFDLRVILFHALSVLHFLDTVFFHVGIIIGIVHTVNHSFGHSRRRFYFLLSPLSLSSSFSFLIQCEAQFFVPTFFCSLRHPNSLLLPPYICISQKMRKTQPNGTTKVYRVIWNIYFLGVWLARNRWIAGIPTHIFICLLVGVEHSFMVFSSPIHRRCQWVDKNNVCIIHLIYCEVAKKKLDQYA